MDILSSSSTSRSMYGYTQFQLDMTVYLWIYSVKLDMAIYAWIYSAPVGYDDITVLPADCLLRLFSESS